MSVFSDLDMLYDYEKDCSAAATGYMTLCTRSSNSELISRYMDLATEASKVNREVRSLIEKFGGIA
jgi:hypothetical protein